MKLPKWITRDKAEDARREQSSTLRNVTVLDELNGLKIKLEMTVSDLESMVDKDDS